MSYWQALAPEIVVAVFGILCLSAGMIGREGSASWARPIALVGLILGAVVALWQSPVLGWVPEMQVGPFVGYVRAMLCGVGAIVVLSAWALPAGGRTVEMFALLLFSVLGAMLVASADDLVLLFFALELVSVPTYAMVAAGSSSRGAQEAGLKYFFLGALSSAILVYGLSFLYGAAGTTSMFLEVDGQSVASAVQARLADNPIAWLGVILTLLGLTYKIAAAPMHFYVADVYQGAAAPVSGMLSYVPKFAGLVAMMKILALIGWPLEGAMYWLVWLMAAATMTVGNALALLQDNVKRMLGYSSVAHSGYMLIGLLVGPALLGAAGPMQNGLAAILFYIVAYGIMNIGAFALIAYLAGDGPEPQMLSSLAGLGRRRPGAALALALCVFSLLGIPPTVGFFGKVYLFGSALSLSEGTAFPVLTKILVVIALLNTAVSAGYYLRIIAAVYIRPAEGPGWAKASAPVGAGLIVCAVLVLAIGLRPGRLAGPAFEAADSMRTIPARPAEPGVLPMPAAIDKAGPLQADRR